MSTTLTAQPVYITAKNPKNPSDRRRKARLREFVNQSKTPCVDCGIKDPREVQWHHLDGDGAGRELSRLVSKGKNEQELQAEIAKCICLCRHCHSKRHWSDPLWRKKHMAARTPTITAATVLEIRLLVEEGSLSQEAIAKRFGVSQGTVSQIKNGKTRPDVLRDLRNQRDNAIKEGIAQLASATT